MLRAQQLHSATIETLDPLLPPSRTRHPRPNLRLFTPTHKPVDITAGERLRAEARRPIRRGIVRGEEPLQIGRRPAALCALTDRCLLLPASDLADSDAPHHG
jgi:hypothetical protein